MIPTIRISFSFLLAIFITAFCSAQDGLQNDAVLKELIEKRNATADKGLSLINSGNFQNANAFYSNAISEDQSNSHAYFNRAVTNWAMSDTLSACRDWSAVLALGDTEMFNLLDSRCHGSMIIANDTIPKAKYHSMFAKAGANDIHAKTVVSEMPEFPGGNEKLAEFISTHLRKPKEGKKGMVYVNLLISPKGKIVYPYVARGLGNNYDKEALRMIRSMPDWKPGKQNGKPTYVRTSVPVRF